MLAGVKRRIGSLDQRSHGVGGAGVPSRQSADSEARRYQNREPDARAEWARANEHPQPFRNGYSLGVRGLRVTPRRTPSPPARQPIHPQAQSATQPITYRAQYVVTDQVSVFVVHAA